MMFIVPLRSANNSKHVILNFSADECDFLYLGATRSFFVILVFLVYRAIYLYSEANVLQLQSFLATNSNYEFLFSII